MRGRDDRKSQKDVIEAKFRKETIERVGNKKRSKTIKCT